MKFNGERRLLSDVKESFDLWWHLIAFRFNWREGHGSFNWIHGNLRVNSIDIPNKRREMQFSDEWLRFCIMSQRPIELHFPIMKWWKPAARFIDFQQTHTKRKEKYIEKRRVKGQVDFCLLQEIYLGNQMNDTMINVGQLLDVFIFIFFASKRPNLLSSAGRRLGGFNTEILRLNINFVFWKKVQKSAAPSSHSIGIGRFDEFHGNVSLLLDTNWIE